MRNRCTRRQKVCILLESRYTKSGSHAKGREDHSDADRSCKAEGSGSVCEWDTFRRPPHFPAEALGSQAQSAHRSRRLTSQTGRTRPPALRQAGVCSMSLEGAPEFLTPEPIDALRIEPIER